MKAVTIFQRKFAIVMFFALLTAYTIARYSNDIRNGGHPYLTGDWLINYQGGFNGRGLFGELILQIHQLLGASILWTTFILQASLFVALIWQVFKMFKTSSDFSSILILLNPAFILFYFLDTGGAFRKELIGYVAVCILANIVVNPNKFQSRTIIALMLFGVCSFSWDASFVLCPIMLFLVREISLTHLRGRNFLNAISILVIMTSLFVISRGVYLKLNRDPLQSIEICKSLTDTGLSKDICSGTISSISTHPGTTLQILELLFKEYDFWAYGVLAILALVPFLFQHWFITQRSLISALLLSSVPLFLLGEDFGRWLHFIVFQLTIMWSVQKISKGHNPSKILPMPRLLNSKPAKIVFLMMYSLTWRAPVAMGNISDLSLGFAARLLSWCSKIVSQLSA